MYPKASLVVFVSLFSFCVEGQSYQPSPTVSQVLLYSTVSNPTLPIPNGPTITFSNSSLGFYKFSGPITNAGISQLGSFGAEQLQMVQAVNQNVATFLSVIPLASPASGLIEVQDPNDPLKHTEKGTLGTIFTERAETIGKKRFFIGISHQDTHFTSFNGKSLNAITTLYPGGEATQITGAGQTVNTSAVSVNLGFDVRLVQDLAILTYGVTDHFDLAVGLPMVHAAVSARTYDGVSYVGSGAAVNQNNNCWCATTFSPGIPQLQTGDIGSSSHTATGFGDLLIRAKQTVFDGESTRMAVGVDLRFPTGDEKNFLGSGATSVKPFVAATLYTKTFANSVRISPHADIGWQFIGKSILGGIAQPSATSVNTPSGAVSYYAAPFTTSKDYLPDVLNWAVGAEIGFGRNSTLVADVIGSQIGLVHGIVDLRTIQASGTLPCGATIVPGCTNTAQTLQGLGVVGNGRRSYGQYSGSFGYKVRVWNRLIFMFNALTRFDNNGLTARFVPLYGIGFTH